MYEEYFEHVSLEISEEIKEYANDVALSDSRYLFTRREGKHQYAYCTHCHEEIETIGLRHNEETKCPKCKSDCTVKASGRGRKKMLDEVYFTYYEKSRKDPNVIVARGIYATRDYRNSYFNVTTNYWIDTVYIFQQGKSTMFKSWYWRRDHFEKCSSIYSLMNYWGNKSYILNSCYSRESIRKAVVGTPFQYSTWQEYYVDDMVKFFDLYSKSPCIEYLTKEGFSGLVEDKLNGYPTYRTVNWRANSIFKILKVDKNMLKEIKAQKAELTFNLLLVLQDTKKQNWNLTIKEAVGLVKNYGGCYDSLKKLTQYAPMKKNLKYFSNQYKNYKEHFYQESSVVTTFKDYIADCQKLGMDINNEHVLFAKDLYTAHQNTIIQIKVQANKKYDDQIQKRLSKLNKYNFKDGDYFIRPAQSSKELIIEGSELHHCVASHYTELYASGKTIILFIRKVCDPNKPFFTMEVNNNIIIQTHGLRNCNPKDEVAAFVEAFKSAKLNKKSKNKIKIPA